MRVGFVVVFFPTSSCRFTNLLHIKQSWSWKFMIIHLTLCGLCPTPVPFISSSPDMGSDGVSLNSKSYLLPWKYSQYERNLRSVEGHTSTSHSSGLKGNFPLLMYWSPKILSTVTSFISPVGHCCPLIYTWHICDIYYLFVTCCVNFCHREEVWRGRQPSRRQEKQTSEATNNA